VKIKHIFGPPLGQWAMGMCTSNIGGIHWLVHANLRGADITVVSTLLFLLAVMKHYTIITCLLIRTHTRHTLVNDFILNDFILIGLALTVILN